MTVFDYAVLTVIAASVLLGLWRGVVSELLALAAWIVAFLVARVFAAEVGNWLTGQIAEPGLPGRKWERLNRHYCSSIRAVIAGTGGAPLGPLR